MDPSIHWWLFHLMMGLTPLPHLFVTVINTLSPSHCNHHLTGYGVHHQPGIAKAVVRLPRTTTKQSHMNSGISNKVDDFECMCNNARSYDFL